MRKAIPALFALAKYSAWPCKGGLINVTLEKKTSGGTGILLF